MATAYGSLQCVILCAVITIIISSLVFLHPTPHGLHEDLISYFTFQPSPLITQPTFDDLLQCKDDWERTNKITRLINDCVLNRLDSLYQEDYFKFEDHSISPNYDSHPLPDILGLIGDRYESCRVMKQFYQHLALTPSNPPQVFLDGLYQHDNTTHHINSTTTLNSSISRGLGDDIKRTNQFQQDNHNKNSINNNNNPYNNTQVFSHFNNSILHENLCLYDTSQHFAKSQIVQPTKDVLWDLYSWLILNQTQPNIETMLAAYTNRSTSSDHSSQFLNTVGNLLTTPRLGAVQLFMGNDEIGQHKYIQKKNKALTQTLPDFGRVMGILTEYTVAYNTYRISNGGLPFAEPYNPNSEDEKQDFLNYLHQTIPSLELAHILQQYSLLYQPILQQHIIITRAIFNTYGKAGVKGLTAIYEKSHRKTILLQEPWYNVNYIRDILRAKFRITTYSEITEILICLLTLDLYQPQLYIKNTQLVDLQKNKSHHPHHYSNQQQKDQNAQFNVQNLSKFHYNILQNDFVKFIHPKQWGWRPISIDLKTFHNFLIEFYFIPNHMDLKQVKHPNHLIYEKWRNDNDVLSLFQQYFSWLYENSTTCSQKHNIMNQHKTNPTSNITSISTATNQPHIPSHILEIQQLMANNATFARLFQDYENDVFMSAYSYNTALYDWYNPNVAKSILENNDVSLPYQCRNRNFNFTLEPDDVCEQPADSTTSWSFEMIEQDFIKNINTRLTKSYIQCEHIVGRKLREDTMRYLKSNVSKEM